MPEWISVNDHLPEHQDEYLVLWTNRIGCTAKLFYAILEYEGDGKWVEDIPQAEPFGGAEVLFWMPLPGRPEEETE